LQEKFHMTDKIVVFNNCGSEKEAKSVAMSLLKARVAACVNILPGVHSLYHWQGAVEESSEWMLVIKTRRELFDRLCQVLRHAHSYEVPEIIAVPVIAGEDKYLSWIDTETASPG
jgi:periplasmic divalent cation tolerance protein